MTSDPQRFVALKSACDIVLKHIYNQTRCNQVHRQRLEFAPSLTVMEALEKEHKNDWADALTSVSEMITAQQPKIVK